MRVGLFIPCYKEAFEPEVEIAILDRVNRYPKRCFACWAPCKSSKRFKYRAAALSYPSPCPTTA